MRVTAVLIALALAAPAIAQSTGDASRACLRNRDIQETKMTRDHQLLAKTGMKQWWRNTRVCDAYQPDNGFVHASPMDEMCRNEIISVHTIATRFELGSCTLGSWERIPAEVGQSAR